MPLNIKPVAFTLQYDNITREIISDAKIAAGILPEDHSNLFQLPEQHYDCRALWDTGATNSSITARAAKALNLQIVDYAKVHHAKGVSDTPCYYVSIFLPSHVAIPLLKVTECDSAEGSFDLLIGMDIISLGDFAITQMEDKTTFSFRVPTLETIDFVKTHHRPIISDSKPGRNDPCYCGSKKKYKHCHEPLDKTKS